LLGPYLFVRFDVARDQWRRVHYTRGVFRIFGAPEAPTPVPDRDVQALQGGEERRCKVRHIEAAPPAQGDAIEVTGGPLKGARGICQALRRGELTALLFLARGPTVVELPAKWCTSA
jgi:transcription antitermination factor NusG